jgi:hypothetical protein
MSNFETELRALIDEWLRRGDAPQSLVTVLGGEVSRMWALVREKKRAR